MGGILRKKIKKPFTGFYRRNLCKLFYCCLDWVSLFATKMENHIRKVHFDLQAMGYYWFLRCMKIFMHSLSIFTIFHEKFYIGICSNQCPCYELKWTSSNWMKIDEKISSNCKSIKRVRKLPQKLFEPVVMYCISLTGYESKCFHTGQDSIKMHLVFKVPWAVKRPFIFFQIFWPSQNIWMGGFRFCSTQTFISMEPSILKVPFFQKVGFLFQISKSPKKKEYTKKLSYASWSETALIYKPRILGLKNEEFSFLVHKWSVI